ncbi:hypothetical protein EJ03DRAFT_149478 [Teratosphaeria nubilosa]|uniref:Uncharacterized protein n=1 Tax=Teratosphaeria nubilosa TaxID=161662 RepID=A0A6G1LJ80_9PEZI|nr:hypothetical protein EJ03DRAFT_149478 [Teratosphaeria nubilosa]
MPSRYHGAVVHASYFNGGLASRTEQDRMSCTGVCHAHHPRSLQSSMSDRIISLAQQPQVAMLPGWGAAEPEVSDGPLCSALQLMSHHGSGIVSQNIDACYRGQREYLNAGRSVVKPLSMISQGMYRSFIAFGSPRREPKTRTTQNMLLSHRTRLSVQTLARDHTSWLSMRRYHRRPARMLCVCGAVRR